MTIYRRTAALFLGLAASALSVTPAMAATGDRDNDGMPNTWEVNQGLSPTIYNPGADPDRDGLTNLAEYRSRTRAKSEDTDGDGAEDGFEIRVRIKPLDRDSNDDGQLDGDEDRDRDGTDNEDEDDLDESCAADDEDRDSDDLANEDENDFGARSGDADSDDDGISDGNEDRDHDGLSNEDEDDDADLDDNCDVDRDNDGRDDEDDEDSLGLIVDYDATTSTLTVRTVNGVVLTLTVPAGAEIDVDDDCVAEESQGDNSGTGSWDPTLADLVPGAAIGEFEMDFEEDVIEEIEISC